MMTAYPPATAEAGQRAWITRPFLEPIGCTVKCASTAEIEVVADEPYVGRKVVLFHADGSAFVGPGVLSLMPLAEPEPPAQREMTCVNCGRPTLVHDLLLQRKLISPGAVRCDLCTAALLTRAKEREVDSERKRRLMEWEDWLACSKAGAMTAMDAFPVRPDFLESLAVWSSRPLTRGFVLSGPSGSGKTTAMFRALRHAFLRGRSCGWITHERLNETFHAASSGRGDTQDSARHTLATLRLSDVLLIDDMGRASEAEAEALKDLLELRTKAGRLLLYTTQFSGVELLQQLSGGTIARTEHALAIARRLKEFSPAVAG